MLAALARSDATQERSAATPDLLVLAMTSEQRQALKLAIDAKRRQATATAPNAIRHGTWYGYSHQRCRCADCARAMRLYTKTRVATNRRKRAAA